MARSTAIPVGEPPDALEAAVQHLGLRRDGLIELLACAQRQQGWLSAPLLGWIARRLQLPHSQVLGTASFYHLFRLQPPLPHSCLVCTGTACRALAGLWWLSTCPSITSNGAPLQLPMQRTVPSSTPMARRGCRCRVDRNASAPST